MVSLWLREQDSNISKNANNNVDLKVELDLYLKNLPFSKDWKNYQRRVLQKLLRDCPVVNKQTTIEYNDRLKQKFSSNYSRKMLLVIRSFLHYLCDSGYSEFEFYKVLKTPREVKTDFVKHVTRKDIDGVLESFNGHRFEPQIRALIMLGCNSGLRAEEIYQLTKDDIDLGHRIIHVRKDEHHTVKTGKARTAFITKRCAHAIKEYYAWRESNKTGLTLLFSQSHLTRIFSKSQVKIKDLRKFFSQEWDRRGGPTSIKKIIMGHSMRGDVDLSHYNFQSEDELHAIYDKIMGGKP